MRYEALTAAANMDKEAAAVAAHVRQHGAIHAHGTEEIRVKNALSLFERVGLGGPRDHNRRC
jgi:hypothetical protein